MQETKIKSYIGFAIRMNKVLYGLESIKRSKKKLYVVAHDNSLGGSAKKSITNYCNNHDVPLIELPYLLGEATKKEKTKLIGVLDESLGKAIVECSQVTEVQNEQ